MRKLMFLGLALFTMMLVGCSGCESDIKTGHTMIAEMNQTEENQARLSTAQPPPRLDASQERANLIEKLKRVNRTGRIGYVYLVNNQGNVVAYFTIRGKVSSLNSLLTTPEQVILLGDKNMNEPLHWEKVPSPDFDGSYGKNPEGIFFFTTDGNMIETTIHYIYSDRPMKINTPVVLTSQVDMEKRGNGK